jgi:hypothetical protein
MLDRDRYRDGPPAEPLAVLLLPCVLEQFDHAAHARELLEIPRVIALEPPGRHVPRWLRDTIPARQVKRLRFPGEPIVVVLYHPAQYPLARAICARYVDAELWYLGAGSQEVPGYTEQELREFDLLARDRASRTIALEDGALRARLRELGIISSRAFVPGARIEAP